MEFDSITFRMPKNVKRELLEEKERTGKSINTLLLERIKEKEILSEVAKINLWHLKEEIKQPIRDLRIGRHSDNTFVKQHIVNFNIHRDGILHDMLELEKEENIVDSITWLNAMHRQFKDALKEIVKLDYILEKLEKEYTNSPPKPPPKTD